MIKITPSFKFKLNPRSYKIVNVKYNIVNDLYVVSGSSDDRNLTEVETIKNWSKAAHRYSNIQLKVEHDWQMCYLARTKGAERSHIEWSFDLEESLLKNINLKFASQTFHTGQIRVVLTVDRNGSVLDIDLTEPKAGKKNEAVWEYEGGFYMISFGAGIKAKNVCIRADMWSGDGENAWQHTQLFRQSLKDKDTCLFSITFNFD